MTKKELKELYERENILPSLINYGSEVDIAETFVHDWYYQLGRLSLVDDLIKKEFGYREREFQLRKKRGTLFEKV